MNKIIVIEGTDGCGKETQSQKLVNYLKTNNFNVLKQDFPNYNSLSSAPVKMLLNGELGTNANTLDAYQSSILFAVDRLCTFEKDLNKALTAQNTILVLDRYVESNLLYQASKINNTNEQAEFEKWLFDLEYNKLKLPKPDVVIYLNLPPEITRNLIKQREKKKSGQENDIYENDIEYMKNVYKRGLQTAINNNWEIIDCLNSSGELKTKDEIHALVIQKVMPYITKN